MRPSNCACSSKPYSMVIVAEPRDIGTPTWWASVGYLAFGGLLSLISALKGKFMSAIIGIVVQPVALIAAIRLAKPTSWWSRRFYTSRPRRQKRSAKRFGERYDRRWNRLRDVFAGSS